MANDTNSERVQYSFEGSVESLRAATKAAINLLDNYQSKVTQSVGYAFSPMARMAQRMSTIFNSVIAKIQSFKDKAKDAMERVSSVTQKVTGMFKRQKEAVDGDGEAAERSSKKWQKFTSSVLKLKSVTTGATAVLKALGSVVSSLVSIELGKWLGQAAQESINYTENMNLFKVAMQGSVDAGLAFVSTMQELYGMDPSSLLKHVGNFYQLATAISMPDEAARNLALTLTKATNDISSLFNVDVDTVYENLISGMQGMSRAVRKYGIDIRATTLQEEALRLGITERVDTMSEANRQGLRFLTIMKQTTNATGDFAKTIETPANQLRIFKEQMAQLGRAIGNFFVGPLRTALQYLNGFIMALRTVLTFVASALNILTDFTTEFEFSGVEDGAKAVEGLGKAASGAAAKVKKLLAPFDELNVLQSQSAGGGASSGGLLDDVLDPTIAAAIAEMEYSFENVRMKANQVRDSILEFLGFRVNAGEILEWDASVFESNLRDTIDKLIDGVFEVLGVSDTLQKALGDAFSNIGTTLVSLWSNIVWPLLQTVIGVLSDVWNNHLKPFWSHLAEAILEVWNETLAPFINWFAENIGRYLVDVIRSLYPVFESVFGAIITIMDGLVYFLQGVLKFITGVFSGDIMLAMEGIAHAVGGMVRIVQGLVTGMVNVVIDVVNGFVSLVWPLIRSVGNSIGNLVRQAGDLLGKDWGWTMPAQPKKIPHLANGGVITGPTYALLGEARRDEAVIPLDNSPQMREFAQAVADAVSNKPGPSNQPMHVHVYIGNDELDEYIYDANARRDLQTNGG